MTKIEFDALIQQIESYKTKTEPLTSGEAQFVQHYSKLYNSYIISKSGTNGVTATAEQILIDQAGKLQELYAQLNGNDPLIAYEPPVTAPEPTVPDTANIKLDPTNPTKFINELVAAGSDIETGTKVEDISKLQGSVNEYSSPVTLIESVKKQVAQTSETAAIAFAEAQAVPEGISIETIEALKNDVSQLLQEGEIAVVPEIILNKNDLPLYRGSIEGQLSIFNIKQDTFDANVKIANTSLNPYDTTALDNYAASVGVELLQAQEIAAELEKLQQEIIAQEQATAVESFTGGG